MSTHSEQIPRQAGGIGNVLMPRKIEVPILRKQERMPRSYGRVRHIHLDLGPVPCHVKALALAANHVGVAILNLPLLFVRTELTLRPSISTADKLYETVA